MNKAYRLIWSDITNAWVVVSEITKARGKRSGAQLVAKDSIGRCVGHYVDFLFKGVFSALMFAGIAYAAPAINELPTGGQVVAVLIKLAIL